MKKRFVWTVVFIAVLTVAVAAINIFMTLSVNNLIGKKPKNADCIIVFGCGLKADGTPSDMLRDRLVTGIDAYNKGLADKIIMSGDHGRKDYDEVNVMKSFAVEHGVKSEDVFMDHAGFSTYESLYRAKEIFEAETVVCVTQKYHLYRALYIAKSLDIRAVGISADIHEYKGQYARETREILARTKDFLSLYLNRNRNFWAKPFP